MNYRKWILFAIAIGVYLVFRASRDEFPNGVFGNSLPSALFIPAALPAVDIINNLFGKNPQWSERLTVIAGASLMSVVLFEGIAPLLTARATGDFLDCVGLMSGGAIYIAVLRHGVAPNNSFKPRRRKKRRELIQATPSSSLHFSETSLTSASLVATPLKS